MVWFRTKEPGIGLFRSKTTKFIKKFKNGKPDLDYFGSGMYANYLSSPAEFNMKSYEIFPTLTESPNLARLVTNAPRSFELHKQGESDLVYLVIRSMENDIDGYAKSLSLDYRNMDSKLSLTTQDPIHPDYKTYFFDFELVNQFNFTGLEPRQEPIINNLIRFMTGSKNCGILVQFLFTNSLKWNNIAELAASNLNKYLKSVEMGKTSYFFSGFDNHFLPKIKAHRFSDRDGLSSFSYQSGKNLEKHYFLKVNSTPITLAIRGMIIGPKHEIHGLVSNLTGIFSSIRFASDALDYFDYKVTPFLGNRWLENNNMATKYAYDIFKKNGNMWSDMRWGKGRDFVPFLCLMPEEFSTFVSLPTDPNLPVSYRRKNIKGGSYHKRGLRMGEII